MKEKSKKKTLNTNKIFHTKETLIKRTMCAVLCGRVKLIVTFVTWEYLQK